MTRAEINRIGRWTVVVDGNYQSSHNEQKESIENAVWLKYNYPNKNVMILPPIMEVTLNEQNKPELITGGENVKMT